MPSENSFVSLHEAVAQALRMGGPGLLGQPQRLAGYVLDLADKSLPEVRLILKQMDDELLGPLAKLTSGSDTAAVRVAASRMEQILQRERFVNESLAARTSNELAGGVARYLGIPFTIPSSQPPADTATNAASTAQTPEPVRQTRPQGTAQQTLRASDPARAPSGPSYASPATQPIQQPVQAVPSPPQAPPPAPQRKGHGGIAVFLVVLVVAAAVGAYYFLGGEGNANSSASSGTDDDWYANVSIIDPVSMPNINEGDGTYVQSKTENGLEQYWIMFSEDNSGGATSVLYLKNVSGVYKDVDVSFQFYDSEQSEVSSEAIQVWSLSPNEVTCVLASGASGSVTSSYNYTIYDARKANTFSIRGALSCSIASETSDGITVELLNESTTTVHISNLYVFGYQDDGSATWASTFWQDDAGNVSFGEIPPGESVEVEFEGSDWSSLNPDFFPIGYADAP